MQKEAEIKIELTIQKAEKIMSIVMLQNKL